MADAPLTVTVTHMRESSGNEWWSAHLYRATGKPLAFTEGYEFYQSPIKGRVDYEADCMRKLLDPSLPDVDILAYDTDAPATPSPPVAAPPAAPVAYFDAENNLLYWADSQRCKWPHGSYSGGASKAAGTWERLYAQPQPQPAQPLTDKDLDAEIERLTALKKERATAFFEARIGLPCSRCGDGKYRADGNGYSQFHRCDKCHHVPMWNGDSEWLAPGIPAPSTPTPEAAP